MRFLSTVAALSLAWSAAAAAEGDSTTRILVAFHSLSGNTETMAQAVRDGADLSTRKAMVLDLGGDDRHPHRSKPLVPALAGARTRTRHARRC